MARTAEEFHEVWHRLLELHAKRWATASHPGGVFDRPRFRAFHERAARELLANDQLRLAWLECDGLPIAAEYQFLDARTLYAYQSGMDPALGRFQPGNLSLIATIRFAIEYQLSSVDLLRGDEPYKAHWRAQPQARADVRVWPGKLTDHLEKTLGSVRAVAKDWLRSTERVGSS
jgi:CelD/BcsL family acetyltransferase involved in cellulose biosynthesis